MQPEAPSAINVAFRLCSLHKATDYSGNYARILAASRHILCILLPAQFLKTSQNSALEM